MEQITNQITLRGTLTCTPAFSHENHGRHFFRFFMKIPRLSSNSDILPVIIPGYLLEGKLLEEGMSLCVSGQIRSHNLRADGKRHLSIFVFASCLEPDEEEPLNHVTLEGIVCREPSYRRTPLGREICDLMLAVPRGFQRTDYLPCILWGTTAREAASCRTGDMITICGRFQSRPYTKLTEEGPVHKTAYEISALTASFPQYAT